jgi:signal transduction histidine kinase/CheY-like chemotaxis protein
MLESIQIILDMLSQLTGGRGGIDNVVVNYVVAAAMFGVFFFVASAKYRQDHSPREYLLLWGFGLGLAREVFMVVLAVIQALGGIDKVALHEIFPPLEHAVRAASLIVVAGAYLRYLVDDSRIAVRYLQVALSTTLLCYLATFWWWAGFIQANPSAKFGQVWPDWVFHINSSIWFALGAVILATKTSGWTRNAVVTAFICFFIGEFLKIPDMALNEVYIKVFTPISRLFYFAGLFIIGYVYVRESSLEVRRYTMSMQSEIRARTVAEQAAQAKGNFLATMSHEIRTPLNGVIGLGELLAKTPLNDEQREYVNTINQSGQITLQVLNDILDYSKIEAGGLSIEHLPFKLNDLLEECYSLFLNQARSTGVALELQVQQKSLPETVVGDPMRVRQVMTNLLSNAYKFTKKGQVTLRVSSQPHGSDKVSLRFEVQDTGIGMTPQQCSALFKAYSQAETSTSRIYGGTGLGLSISSQLVKRMGGEINVQSSIGQGSTFWFSLTLSLPDKVADAAAQNAAPLAPMQFPHMRALIAEDNAINHMVMAAQLKHLGVLEVSTARDGLQALSAAQQASAHFDVIFMDCEMPVLNGYLATQRLRAWEQTEQRHPVYICGASAHAITEYRERGMAAGMNQFITKPLRIEDLQHVLIAASAHAWQHIATAH